jgi:hypothetical protein
MRRVDFIKNSGFKTALIVVVDVDGSGVVVCESRWVGRCFFNLASGSENP